jgi:hypothetical protein
MRRTVLRALALLAAMGCATAPRASAPVRDDRGEPGGPPSNVDPPFAAVVGTELSRVAQPVMIRQSGREEAVTDFVILYVQLAQPARWLPRGAPTEQIALGGSLVRALSAPGGRVTPLLAARLPAGDLATATLWVLPWSPRVGDIPLSELTTLEREAKRGGASTSVALPPSLLPSPEVRQFPSIAELTAHARTTAAALATEPRR